MQVYNIRMLKGLSSGGTKAYATIITKEGLLIEDFRVAEGKYGLFVGWPFKRITKPGEEDKFFNTVKYGDNEELRDEVQRIILAEYLKESGESSVGNTPTPSKDWKDKGKEATVTVQVAQENSQTTEEDEEPWEKLPF